jgi:hypothetical protein
MYFDHLEFHKLPKFDKFSRALAILEQPKWFLTRINAGFSGIRTTTK